MRTIVFLGGGRITSAMLAGLRLTKTKYHFVVHDRNRGKLRDLSRRYAVAAEPNLRSAIRLSDLLIIAVRPDSVPELLGSVGKAERPLLAVSLAAGIPLRRLTKALGPPVRWARAMPSPVCRSGNGLTAVTFPRALPRRDRSRVIEFFASLGEVIEIPESKFDAFTVIYSSSHGYHALSALSQAGQAIGLDRRMALTAGAHALAAGILASRDGKHSLDSLLAEAATPGGIAATTTAAMDASGYRTAVAKGVRAGFLRARANRRL